MEYTYCSSGNEAELRNQTDNKFACACEYIASHAAKPLEKVRFDSSRFMDCLCKSHHTGGFIFMPPLGAEGEIMEQTIAFQEVHGKQPKGDSLPPESNITPLQVKDLLVILEQSHA